jgi:hexosaminidase
LSSLHGIYNYHPIERIAEEKREFVTDVQENLWTEYVWEESNLEWKMFPRATAIAEDGWMNQSEDGWSRFLGIYARVECKRLENHATGIRPVDPNWMERR